MRLTSHPSAHALLAARDDTLQLLAKEPWCDVLIVGGGIHGATFAHLAALNGLRTVLLERSDYGCGTSSRSSKLAHGGVRYLEHFDFRQVYEGIRERETLYRVAPHLVHAQEFVAPTLRGEWALRTLMGLGLGLYAMMAGGKTPLPRSAAATPPCSDEFGKGYRYFDGILSDTRLVIERILAARQEGAHCLNYAESQLFLPNPQGVEVRWRDVRTGQQFSTQAGAVINTAGPWIAESGGLTTQHVAREMRLSRGSHILFSRSWEGPALVLPLREGRRRVPGRYYFVTPHPAGTLVGTTEREVQAAEVDPLPSADELDEIFGRLDSDLPGSGLTRAAAHYCFAGTRVLPISENAAKVEDLSRQHRWHYRHGILTLIGGKYTTAAWTCEQGFRLMLKLKELDLPVTTLAQRILPGAAELSERSTEFGKACAEAGVSDGLRDRALARLGGRALKLLEYSDGLTPIAGQILTGEFRLAIDQEQAITVEDLLRRRTELEYFPGHGIEAISALQSVLGADIQALECAKYVERMQSIAQLIAAASAQPAAAAGSHRG